MYNLEGIEAIIQGDVCNQSNCKRPFPIILTKYKEDNLKSILFVLRKLAILWSVALVLSLFFTILPLSSEAAETSGVVYQTNFDGGGLFIVDYAKYGWSRGDYVAGQDDTWCRVTTHMNISAHSSPGSLWCAKIGVNKQNGMANIDNKYPDRSMESWVRLAPANATKYDDMTLTFWYWAWTGKDSTALASDRLSVNINDGSETSWGVWKQPSANSQGWKMVTIDLPKGTVWVEWDFKTGPTTPAGGPYPGAFIDDVKITATGASSLATSAGPLNSYYNTSSIQIPYKVTDAGMGLDYVELYYRVNGWPWSKYTTASNPDGQFTSSPIAFEAEEDGQYDFYTLAMDQSENVEEDSGTADASVVVDTVAPVSEMNTTAEQVANGWFNSSVSVSFNAQDNGSGANQTFYRVNQGSWSAYSEDLFLSEEGTYAIDFYSIDKAGNLESAKSDTVSIDTTPPQLEFKTEDGKNFTSPNVIIAWEMSDSRSSISMVQLSVDGGNFTNLGGSAYLCTISSLTNGTHSMVIRIFDEAGNSVERSLDFAVDLGSQGTSNGLSINPVYALIVGAVAVVGVAFILHPSRRRGKGAK